MLNFKAGKNAPPIEENAPAGDKDGNSNTPEEEGVTGSKGQGEEPANNKGNKKDGEAFEDPITNKIDDANNAQKRAEETFNNSGDKSKTVASDDIKTLSGWKEKPEGFTDVTPEQVKSYSNEIGHNPKRAGAMDQINNGGFEGKYNSSHAEKQLLTAKPNEPVGVSRDMCTDCQNFASKQAQTTGESVIVSDPKGTRIFNPDGSVDFIPK